MKRTLLTILLFLAVLAGCSSVPSERVVASDKKPLTPKQEVEALASDTKAWLDRYEPKLKAAIEGSGVLQDHPHIDLVRDRVGVYGKLVGLDDVLEGIKEGGTFVLNSPWTRRRAAAGAARTSIPGQTKDPRGSGSPWPRRCRS